jgi:aspartate-semialdehyde dehydrogenase
MKKTVAVVGATGAVGMEMIRTLEKRKFPVKTLVPLASERSRGRKIRFRGRPVAVETLSEDSIPQVDIALFSAGAERSRRFAPLFAAKGAVVIDNSSAFRMDPEVPLVVPEVNAHAIAKNKGIIANPNCSTIQMVQVLKPLHDVARIKRVVVSTYQSVSGAGLEAIDELIRQTKAVLAKRPVKCKVFPRQIAFNVLPHIDVFEPNGYTKEEMKMVNETHKIMEDYGIAVTATTVRVPVLRGHSESVNVEFERKITPDEAREILKKAPGVVVVDDPAKNKYPLAIDAANDYRTFVGRIREDFSVASGLNMWIVSDNLLKGAALNAVQIAEKLP